MNAHALAYRAHLARCYGGTEAHAGAHPSTITPPHVALAATTLLPALALASRLADEPVSFRYCFYCGLPLGTLPAHVHLVEEDGGEVSACSDCAGQADWGKRWT